MANVQRSNYLPYIQQHLDNQSDDNGMVLETVCGICQEHRLDISKSAREFTTLEDESSTEQPKSHQLLLNYIQHGLEKTVVLACGHVFGDRCIRDLAAAGNSLTCPSCGYRMTYQGCGHAIPPSLIAVEGHTTVRDQFPLTIPEDGKDPHNCLECRWKLIRTNLRYTLADDCVICRQRNNVRIAIDATGHRSHRDQHIHVGIRQALQDIAMLIWPEFTTRETETSGMKNVSDEERRQIHVSLLNAMVLSELEETIWARTKAGKGCTLSKEQTKRHEAGIASVEQSILSWLMDSHRGARRMW
ncbi:hypothetical protein M426DRAFT_323536 [Hypoxylon sp. CI-4A]|nr:hypothetical protein M426DRAFT_323536 [Hypoxylon sp. CI-4A]